MTDILIDAAATAYHRGVAAGQMIAQLGDALGIYTRAARFSGAAPYTSLEQARTHLRLRGDGEALYEASGVLHGFKQATAERPDADVCMGCDRRILYTAQEDEVVSCRTHGAFCDDSCRSGVCDRGCHLRDDLADQPPRWWMQEPPERPEPEFDKEAYYAAKHGDGDDGRWWMP